MTFQWPSSPHEAALEFYDLSHPWGHGVTAWSYSEDVKIERLHGMAKSRVLTQKITTVMHSGTHIDAPGHVVEGAPLLHEIPLSAFFGTGVVVSIPKKKWEVVTPDDLEAARPEIRPGDIVIVNTGWHHHYSDSAKYYAYSPGFYKEAGEWFAAREVKAVGTDTQALDHPLATAIGPHGPAEAQGGLLPWAVAEYEAETGRKVGDDFAEWEPCHRAILSQGIYGFENVGGDLDKVSGKRVTFAAFPWRWVGGDGCIVRLVDDRSRGDVPHRAGPGSLTCVSPGTPAHPATWQRPITTWRRCGCRATRPGPPSASGSACPTTFPAAARTSRRPWRRPCMWSSMGRWWCGLTAGRRKSGRWIQCTCRRARSAGWTTGRHAPPPSS